MKQTCKASEATDRYKIFKPEDEVIIHAVRMSGSKIDTVVLQSKNNLASALLSFKDCFSSLKEVDTSPCTEKDLLLWNARLQMRGFRIVDKKRKLKDILGHIEVIKQIVGIGDELRNTLH